MLKFDVFNRWSGDIQFTAEIDCGEGELPSVKIGLSVKWAYKNGASLVGARLDGASLDGRKIKDAVTLGYPNGWGAWTYVTDHGEQRIHVGCRDKTIAEGRAYLIGKENRREVMAVLDYAEALARIRGWIE